MTENGWTCGKPEHEPIKNLRDKLRNVIPSVWIEETNPHISILPGFEAPSDEMDELLKACEEFNKSLVGKNIEITGFHCYNELDSEEPTFVVSLDVDINLKSIRSKQETLVQQSGGELLYEPAESHITLFKEGDGGDNNDGLTDEQKERVRSRLIELSEEAQFKTIIKSTSSTRF